jgi:hypothetical protein
MKAAALFLLLMPCHACAQADARWTLRPDSVALVPLRDLRTAAVYRLAQDGRMRTAVLEVASSNAEAAKLREALALERGARSEAAKAVQLCRDELAAQASERDRWQRKAHRRGRAVGVLLALAAAFTLATLAP